jgi:hypothetical protein
MTLSTVTVQTTPESQPSTPNWMGEVAAFAQILNQTGILTSITERVRFARARMAHDMRNEFAETFPLVLEGASWLNKSVKQISTKRNGGMQGKTRKRRVDARGDQEK